MLIPAHGTLPSASVVTPSACPACGGARGKLVVLFSCVEIACCGARDAGRARGVEKISHKRKVSPRKKIFPERSFLNSSTCKNAARGPSVITFGATARAERQPSLTKPRQAKRMRFLPGDGDVDLTEPGLLAVASLHSFLHFFRRHVFHVCRNSPIVA